MIVLDTNVVSEAMKPAHRRDPHFDAWLHKNAASETAVSAITIAEIGYGISRLPNGQRRDDLRRRADALFQHLEQLTLVFDTRAAHHYADIMSSREMAGRPIAVLDCMIAAIARSRGASIATRNVKDFEAVPGLNVINPWG